MILPLVTVPGICILSVETAAVSRAQQQLIVYP